MKTTTALLISTYNWPGALDLILKSALKQTRMPDEILIADDGSAEMTRQVIENYIPEFSIPVRHVWHEDKGFRKAMILNKAIARSTSDYIVQVDGDCILHPKFIADHLSFAREGLYLYGTRVRVKQKQVDEVLKQKKIYFHFFSKGIKKRPRSLRIPFLSRWFGVCNTISPKFRGCNTSFWREDVMRINGYNDDMEGWGREDSELMIRLHNAGIKGRRLKFKGMVYHLDHSESSKANIEKNDAIQKTALARKITVTTKGINQYL